MPYRNKVYVAFDGDKDIHYYRLLTAWNSNSSLDFSILDAHDLNTARDSSMEETIKRRLRERFADSKAFLLLVGESTKYLFRFVKWEIETAIRLDIPIIVVNLNKKRSRDDNRCPASVRDQLAVHISFEMKMIGHALNDWQDAHKSNRRSGKTGAYYYTAIEYQQLGL